MGTQSHCGLPQGNHFSMRGRIPRRKHLIESFANDLAVFYNNATKRATMTAFCSLLR
ncbi:hypothetical protein LMG19083_04741 [Ralstonia psammae]|uniref:Transposase n=1 Tax=Ralstonia psammae TaxID=3058598 RepID=A0ABN9JDX9_9RALS|nr:hypothetical protein LMG19083_04741 [Ralstonia sp. LMG 19083]